MLIGGNPSFSFVINTRDDIYRGSSSILSASKFILEFPAKENFREIFVRIWQTLKLNDAAFREEKTDKYATIFAKFPEKGDRIFFYERNAK